MSKVTCRYCKNKIEKDSAYEFRPRMHFCNEECYRAWVETEEGQIDALLDYIWNLYSPEKQTSETYVMLKRQADYYHKEYDFKWKGMLLAFKYYIEILERAWCDEYGMGQVLPTYYIRLQRMYEEQKELKAKLKETDMSAKERIVSGSGHKIHKGLSMD